MKNSVMPDFVRKFMCNEVLIMLSPKDYQECIMSVDLSKLYRIIEDVKKDHDLLQNARGRECDLGLCWYGDFFTVAGRDVPKFLKEYE